ncbi:ATP-dependent helicase fft2 [Neolecta irregularis DAH-3]|uniref:DNA helicase n=1 Tax=Neolecta irregularis (strain DAH-3) TaxID=1198029 RepID=A0A1U7LGR3_NEOID|nr:ATP-dependent helicase fft2 [Neolecta irregularis DAH-3]|eukprot:OLL21846.1 ATP-dependent helicase fft2 [Neolecta irregularis DAH-3]
MDSEPPNKRPRLQTQEDTETETLEVLSTQNSSSPQIRLSKTRQLVNFIPETPLAEQKTLKVLVPASSPVRISPKSINLGSTPDSSPDLLIRPSGLRIPVNNGFRHRPKFPSFLKQGQSRPSPTQSLSTSLTNSPDEIKKEPPILAMKNYASQFKFNLNTKLSPVRLESLSRSTSFASSSDSQSTKATSIQGQARKKFVQKGPSKALPVDFTQDGSSNLIVDHKAASKLQQVFFQFPLSVIEQQLILSKNNVQHARERLSEFTEPDEIVEKPNAPIARRELRTSHLSIRSRYSRAANTEGLLAPISLTQHVSTTKKKFLVSKNHRPVLGDVADDKGANSDGSLASDASSSHVLELEQLTLDFINTANLDDLIDISGSTRENSELVFIRRPYDDLDLIRTVENSGPSRKGKRKRPMGDKFVDGCLETIEGFEAVEHLIKACTAIGKSVVDEISKWGADYCRTDGEITLTDINPQIVLSQKKPDSIESTDTVDIDGYRLVQPSLLPSDLQLKPYQILGVNWLQLLYNKGLSGILADEMGLGKTCQVVSFLGLLLERGIEGPHLIIVPSSTIENWLRELGRFCPSLVVEPYYGISNIGLGAKTMPGSQKERAETRYILEERKNYHVLVTTDSYNLATGSKDDRGFLRRHKFDVCVYDEGHMLKNSQSARYSSLMSLKAKFRLLLTGTPLQNNLQELISLLAFILPKTFAENSEALNKVFKLKSTAVGDKATNLLSQNKITRARTMMKPFILRRKKQQVLSDLPVKLHRVEICKLNAEQKSIYQGIVESKQELSASTVDPKIPAPSRNNGAALKMMMNMRKAANHPLLFRRHYTDDEDIYLDASREQIFEDMEVMTDFELNRLCKRFPSITHRMLPSDTWMKSGKVDILAKILPEMKAKGDRILLFSQFTQVLDILEEVMCTLGITFLRLDGQTAVQERQEMIDQFHDEKDITVFLLSTKAGGFGINLACANVVVIHDGSFNPHDDRQAEDRAHRVGQTRDVEVIRLVTEGTIEEHILSLANTKLMLDQSVSAIPGAELEKQGELEVLSALIEQDHETRTVH